jgi:hypothetical protein
LIGLLLAAIGLLRRRRALRLTCRLALRAQLQRGCCTAAQDENENQDPFHPNAQHTATTLIESRLIESSARLSKRIAHFGVPFTRRVNMRVVAHFS